MSIRARAPAHVTLKALAAEAGVHPSTVSRVANGDPSLRISGPTRERIESLLRRTRYRPNGIARGLRLRQSFVLGVVIPDVTNPFLAALFRGIEDAALPRGYNVILCNTDGSPRRERAQLRMLTERRVDGVFLASAQLQDPTVRGLRQAGLPHVLVNRFSDERRDAFVGSDDLAGARLVTGHLVERGHRRIGHLAGPPSVSTAALRLRGYRQALAEAGLEVDPGLVVESGYVEPGGLQAGLELLGRPPAMRPTAVFAVNDLAALGLYAAARRLGLAIPEEVAIAGYNDIPLAARVEPGLTSVQVPVHEVGTVAARMLIDQIENGAREPRRVVLTPRLVVRASTQPV